MNLGDLLIKSNLKIATAESCTGGRVVDKITNVPGASRYYVGGIIAYSNAVKIQILGVSEKTIRMHGAVSEECAREMAEGAAKIFGADVAIATTGIAGPSGGTKEKPVGTVFIACHLSGETTVVKEQFSGSRSEIKEKAANRAMELMEELLQGK